VPIFNSLLKLESIDINQQNCDGNSVLITACSSANPNFEMIEALLDRKEIDVNALNQNDYSALLGACRREGGLTGKWKIEGGLWNRTRGHLTPQDICDSKRVIALLLERDDIEINSKMHTDWSGQTYHARDLVYSPSLKIMIESHPNFVEPSAINYYLTPHCWNW
jgi:hypothetical protein